MFEPHEVPDEIGKEEFQEANNFDYSDEITDKDLPADENAEAGTGDDISAKSSNDGEKGDTKTPAKTAFDNSMLFDAFSSGIAVEDIKNYGTEGELRAAIAASKVIQASQVKEDKKDEQAEEKPTAPEPFKIPDDVDLDEETKDFMGSLVDSFNARQAESDERMNKMQALLDGHDDRIQAASQDDETKRLNDFANAFDKQCEGQKDWEDVLGKGLAENLDQDSSGLTNRLKLIQTFQTLKSSFPSTTDGDIFNSALSMTFPERFREGVKQTQTKSIDPSRITSRPRSDQRIRSASSETGPDAALKATKGVWAKLFG